MYPLTHIIPDPARANINATFKRFRLQMRYATAGFRTLPHFIIIGAMKSGTTSLFAAITQHPQIIRCYTKEIHFFNKHYHKGTNWYRAHFPLVKKLAKWCKTGEATPQYIYNELVPKRISQLVPRVKLIAILRNPTERTISHYFHEVRKKREDLPIMKAFQAEEKRLERVLREHDFTNPLYFHASYKKRSIYHEQLSRFLGYFPLEQLLVLSSEEFFSQPREIMRQVFSFIGVDENFQVSDMRPKNVGSNRTEVGPEVYEYLNDYFYSHNRELFKMLGNNFDW
jgi:adenylate kinase family enzyme